MKFTKDNQGIKNTITIALIGMSLGFIYPVFADGFGELLPFINGMSIGLIGGVLVALFELYAFNPGHRKLSFWLIVLLKTLLYFFMVTFLTVAIIGFNESVFLGIGFWEHVKGPRFQAFLYHGDFGIIVLYSLVFIGIIIFTREISRKMGPGMLFNIITGKYHHPREEEHIFMFLDIKSSTQIAEKLGAIKFYNLLNDFYHDIAACIIASRGEIYRYVGDQVVITWDLEKGLDNANCIRSYYYVKGKIDGLKEKYLRNYNFVPDFTASLHCGKVIRGEIGEIKSQIVFHGQPLYITAEVEKQCRVLQKSILVTADLIQRISLPVIYEMKQVGQLKLDREMDLYTINEVSLESI